MQEPDRILDIEHVFHSVQAAIKIQRNINTLHPPDAATEPLRFGAGIHTGEVVAGNIGAAQLVSYMAVGDAVNIAFKVVTLSAQLPTMYIM